MIVEAVSNGSKGTEERFQALLKEVARGPSVSFGAAAERELIGRSIGPFRIEAHLGSGGMGAVYLATDDRLGRKVAVKLLPRDVAESPSRRALLLREAKTAAAVSHPNVAAIYEVGEDDGRLYIAMEYVEGRTLRVALSDGPLSLQVAYDYALQVARGMARAHRTGIVHRDLKPDNVMVDRDGTVKILDFGLAKPLADARRSAAQAVVATVEGDGAQRAPEATSSVGWGAVLAAGSELGLSAAGTPGYMAPEQASGMHVDARADIFSFGATAFEMLTGRPGKPNERLPRRIPRRFARIIERCLSDIPAKRPADGLALESALRQYAPSRLPKQVLFGLTALLALGSLTAGISYRVGPKDERIPQLKQLTFNSVEAPILGSALSPDGTLLAYVEPRGVFIQDIASRSIHPLSISPSIDNLWGSIGWFPDGTRLLVGGEIAGRSDLWTVDVTSGAGVPMHLGDWPAFFGAVSPDGKRIAVTTFKGAWNGSVEVVDIDDGRRTTLYETHDEELVETPRWSPDGRRVAFVRGAKTRDYIVHHLDIVDTTTGRRRTVLTHDRLVQETGDVAFNWSNDGRIYVALAPSSVSPANSGLFAFDASEIAIDGLTHGSVELQPVPGFDAMKVYDISFDATGKRMAVGRNNTQADVFLGSVSDDDQRLDHIERVTLSDNNEYPSDWSTDSREVLVSDSDPNRGFGVFALSLESRTALPIRRAVGPATWPVLGPAGRGILYWQLPTQPLQRANLDLMLIEPDREARRIYRTPQEVYLPGRGRPAPHTWSVRCARTSNDCFIAHPSTDEKEETILEALDVEQGTTTQRGRFDGIWHHGFALSSDATRIAVAAANREVINIFDLDGSQLQRLDAHSSHGAFVRSVIWSHDERGVFAAGTNGHTFGGIFYFGLDGRVNLLWSTKEGAPASLRLSPDGRRLAFLMAPLHVNVWLREE